MYRTQKNQHKQYSPETEREDYLCLDVHEENAGK